MIAERLYGSRPIHCCKGRKCWIARLCGGETAKRALLAGDELEVASDSVKCSLICERLPEQVLGNGVEDDGNVKKKSRDRKSVV